MTKRLRIPRTVCLGVLVAVVISGSLAVRAQTNVTLTATTSPTAAQPGITTVSVTGSNFPTGTIAPADVALTIQPATAGAGPTVSTPASAVATVVGTTRRVTFTVPGTFSVASPVAYRVTLAGRTTTGTAFVSANAASLTINPPPKITALTPASVSTPSTATIAITTTYTNFVQGSTQANFGPGIAVGGAAAGAYGFVTVTSPTTATAQIVVASGVASGYRHVSVRTGVQEASIDNVFSVTGSTPTNRPPVANAGGPYSGAPGQAIQFDGRGSTDPDNDPLTYAWQFGDNQTGTGPTPTHAYAAAGQYVVTLTVTDPSAASNTATTGATITQPNRTPTANAGGPYSGQTGTAVAFDGSASSDPDGDALTYVWNFGDGTPTGTGVKPTHTYANANTYVVTLTVTDPSGASNTATTSATITRTNHTPTANAGGPYSGQTGTGVALDGSGSSDPDGDVLTYVWNFGDNTPKGTDVKPTHTYANANTYTVTLTVTDPSAASNTATTSATITAANHTPTANPGGPYNGQTGTAVSFDGSGSSDPDGDALTYSWNFGDGSPASTQIKPTHAYSTAGPYVVTLTVQDTHGAQASATTTAQISKPNGKPTARASGPSTGDVAATLAFRGADSTDPDGDPLTFSWDFGDGSAKSAQTNPSHAFAQAGPYIVALTVTDSFGASDTATVAVTVTVPNHKPTAVPGGPYSGQSGGSIGFDGSASSDPDGDALTYLWDFGDGSAKSSVAKPSHSFAAGGNYVVALTVTDTHGASDTATVVAAVTGANHPPTANAGGPYTGEAGVAVAIDGSQSSDPDGTSLTFSWDFGDASPKGNGSKPSHVYATPGTYAVSLTVTDPGGLTASASTTATVTTSVDRVPPVVTLSGAKQALPGSQVVVTADATDNVAVSSVTLTVNGADPVSYTVGPYQRTITVPDIAAPGSEIKVHALAKDPSNNEGTADHTITIVAVPDTSKPTVTLTVPPQAAAGSSILVTADAQDNVAVTGVDFSQNTTPIGSAAKAPYQVPYVIPADAPIGAVLTFMAQASDAAGNRAQATATLTVVGAGDVNPTPPTVTVSAPTPAVSGTSIKLSAAAVDVSGIASVTFSVDGAKVATSVTPPYETPYSIATSIAAGTQLHVEARAVNTLALEATAATNVDVIAPGDGVLTGAVFDDAIGLPVAGANVQLIGKDARGIDYTQTAVSDSRGEYVLHATEGNAIVSVSKPGWTRLDRQVTIEHATALHVVDARLTNSGLVSSAIAAATGGTLGGPGQPFLDVWQRDLLTLNDPYVTLLAATGPTVSLAVPSGTLANDATLTLTPVSRQGLAGLLPIGWTPIAAADLAPHGTKFLAATTLTVPLPFGLDAGTPLVVAQWDDNTRNWTTIAHAAADPSAKTLTASLTSTGQIAWLLADTVPTPPPPAIVGDAVPGVDAALIPADATAIVDPQPRIIFYKPGVKSDVRGRVTSTVPLSSGTLARTRILEQYNFFSGAHMQLDPTLEDVVLYQVPGTGGKALVAGYPVAPSLTFEALSLQTGIITVELRAPGARQESVQLINATGGSAATSTGERIDVSAGAMAGPLPVTISALTAAEIGVPAPDGFDIVGAVLLDFANVLSAPASLSVPRTSQVLDGDLILVTRMQELVGETRFVTVGLGNILSDRISSITTLAGSAATFDGVRAPGRYVFLRAKNPLGFSTGVVTGTNAAPFSGAMISPAPTSTLVAVSQSTGRYISTIALGGTNLTARNPIMGDSATGTATATIAGQVVTLDFALVAHFPTVTSVNPGNGAEGVPLSGPIVVTFSSPIDPATATATSIALSSAGGLVAGTREVSNGNTVVTFRSSQPLASNTSYTLTITTAIADPFGRALQAALASTFTSLNISAPPPPPAGSITASIPGTDGQSTITVTQGAAGSKDTVVIRNVTKGTFTPISVVDPSVGFTVKVLAATKDKLQIVIRSQAGNETVQDIPAFRSTNPDGSTSEVASSAGGRIWGPGQGENRVAVDIPAGALPDGTVVTLKPVSEADFAYKLSDAEKTIFTFAGAISLDLGGATPTTYLNLSIPAGPDDTVDGQWLVGTPTDVFGLTQLNTTDTARVINDRITTASPPCPGVTGNGVYGFLKGRRDVGINYGRLGGALAQLVADVSYPPALLAVGFALPFIEQGLMQAQQFCIPSLTGRVTVTENFVRLAIHQDKLSPADRELVANNSTRSTEYHFPRDVVEYTFTVDGQESDKFDVFLKDASGSEQWFLFFKQDTGSAGSVTLRIHNDQFLAGDKQVHIVATDTSTTPATTTADFTASLASGRHDFEVDGKQSYTFAVEIVDKNGGSRTVGSSGFDVADPVNAVVIRLNANKITTPSLQSVRLVNRTRDSQTTIPIEATSVKVSVPGGPSDTYVLHAIDVDGTSRQVPFDVVPTTFGTGNLVLRARAGTIDPTALEIAQFNLDFDGDGYLDGYEKAAGTNPFDPTSYPNQDSDGDGCSDQYEKLRGTNPFDPSSKPASCPAPITAPAQDPANAPVTGAGRTAVTLTDRTTGTQFIIPPSAIQGGAIAFPFNADPTDKFNIQVDYDDGKVEEEDLASARITVRNALTGDVVKTIDTNPPAKGDLLSLGPISDDVGPPVLTGGPTQLTAVDPTTPLTFTFNEPLSPGSVTTSTIIVEHQDSTGNWKAVGGDLKLSTDQRSATFTPTTGLSLGEHYRVRFSGVTDLAGNALLAQELPFSTFAPKRICPPVAPGCMATVQTYDGPTDQFRRVQDLKIVQKMVTVGTQTVVKTNLVGITQGSSALDLGGSQMITYDVTDPGAPIGLGKTSLGRQQQRLTLLKDVTMPTGPIDPTTGNLTGSFTGTIALSSQYNNTLSNINFSNITDLTKPGAGFGPNGDFGGKVITRNPVSLSGNPSDQSAHGTYEANGYGRGVATLKYQGGYMSYMAMSDFGIAMADIGKNIPEIIPTLRQREPTYAGDYYDVVAVNDRLVAANRSDKKIEVFDPNLTPLADLTMADGPRRIVYVEGFQSDQDGDGIITPDETRNLAFVAADTCGDPGSTCAYAIDIVDLTSLDSPSLVGRIPMPGAIHGLDVDAAKQRLYATVDCGTGASCVQAFVAIDVSKPDAVGIAPANLIDHDGDPQHWDDRIVWHAGFPDASLLRPPVSDGSYLFGVTVDSGRGLVYVGNAWGIDAWAAYDGCCDIAVDFTAKERRPITPPPAPKVEKKALQTGIAKGLADASALCPGGAQIGSLLTQGKISILEQGSGACIWRGENGDCQTTYQPGLSDHDYEVFVPAAKMPAGNPDADILCLVQTLNGAFIDPTTKEPVTFPIDGYQLQFDDVTFFPMPREEFEKARLNINPPTATGGTDTTGDLGLGRQQLLLKWLLEGAYINVPGYVDSTTGRNLLEGKAQNLILDNLRGLFGGINGIEGYEWALLQQFALLKSQALIRVVGASTEGTSLHNLYIKQLHDAAKAGIRATLAALIGRPGGLTRDLVLDYSTGYSSNACFDVNPALAPGAWRRHACSSFEEFIAGAAIEDYLESPFFPAFDLPNLLQIHRFFRVKSDLEMPANDTDADYFVAGVAKFIARAQTKTFDTFKASCGSSDPTKWTLGDCPQRLQNINDAKNKITKAMGKGSLHVIPSTFNLSFQSADQVDLAMYRVETPSTPNNGTLITHKTVNVPAGSRQFYDYDSSLPPSADDLTNADLNELDLSKQNDPKKKLFVLGEAPTGINPYVPLDSGDGVPHMVAFTLDLNTDGTHVKKEANRQNNLNGFFYYVRAWQDDTLGVTMDWGNTQVTSAPIPVTGPVTLPFPDPTGKVLNPDAECQEPPKLSLFQSANNDIIRFSVTNTSNDPLTAVRVCSNAANTCTLVGSLAPGQSTSFEVHFTVPPNAATISSVASVTAIGPTGDGVALVSTQQLLNVESPISVRLFDSTDIGTQNFHPFSRFLIAHTSTGDEEPMIGTTTDGTEKALHIVIAGLKPSTAFDISLNDTISLPTTDGIGELMTAGGVKGTSLTLMSDGLGQADLYYNSPQVFVRETRRLYDFDLKSRGVKLTVYQNDVGTRVTNISLVRPPVFLVHGLFGTIHVWGCFQPLVPAPPADSALSSFITTIENELNGADIGLDPCLFDKSAQYYKARAGFDGRFDLFNVGMPGATASFAAGVDALANDIKLSLMNFRKGYAIGKIDLVGHSMGGVLSKRMTTTFPTVQKAIRKLIVMNSPLLGSELADFIVQQRNNLEPVKFNTNVVDYLWAAAKGSPDDAIKKAFKADTCGIGIKLLGLTPKFNIYAGAIDDLQTAGATVPPFTVPTHHITTATTVVGGTILPDLAYSTEVKLLWSILGSYCNATPANDTIEATKQATNVADIVKVALSLFGGFKASTGEFLSPEVAEGFMKGLKTALGKTWKEEVLNKDPKPIFGSQENDRIVARPSQLGGMTDSDPFETQIFGKTDHQAAKITPDLTPEACMTTDINGPKIRGGPTVNDLNFDGKPDVTCRVIELLEADPKGTLFKQ